MEKDTVLLSVKEYNDLRDFKINFGKEAKNKKITTLTEAYRYGGFGSYVETVTYYTEDEIISSLCDRNNAFMENVTSLNKELDKLKSNEGKLKLEIECAKNMNFYQFYKWKRK